MEFRKFGDTYIVRIQRGEEILAALRQLCQEQNITLASVSGIGAVGDVTLGVFNREKSVYESVRYQGDMEIASCSGTITTMDGAPYLHIHMVAVNPVEGVCYGGHLNEGIISLTGEFVVTALHGTVERKYSPEVGLNLFEFV